MSYYGLKELKQLVKDRKDYQELKQAHQVCLGTNLNVALDWCVVVLSAYVNYPVNLESLKNNSWLHITVLSAVPNFDVMVCSDEAVLLNNLFVSALSDDSIKESFLTLPKVKEEINRVKNIMVEAMTLLYDASQELDCRTWELADVLSLPD